MRECTEPVHRSRRDPPSRLEAPESAKDAALAKTYRCAVVSSVGSSRGAACVMHVIREMDGVDALPLDDTAGVAGDCDAVIFVAGGDSVAGTLDRIGRWRVERPAIPILLAGIGLEAGHLSILLGQGVHDFVSLPCVPHELAARLRRTLGMHHAVTSLPVTGDPRLRHFIGGNPAFARQVAKLPVYAACDAGVLIVGETGTGKEVCAQAVHYLSARSSKPWVAVNCGAMPTELIENELFGHAKGAFTTAHMSRAGLVREAEGGSLFLDDVDCLPLSAQVKLLRFLQEREYRPVGSTALHRADVRVIAASNHRLPSMVARGEFRQDLYFRLNVLMLQLPPLRERRDDIALLTVHFMRRFAAQHGRRVDGVAPRALERLFAHDWPGNVRELQHVIERAVLLANGSMLLERDIDLPGTDEQVGMAHAVESFSVAKGRIVRQFERSYIEHLLVTCDGNVTHAAQLAGKNRRAFFELMRKHEIAAAVFRRRPGDVDPPGPR